MKAEIDALAKQMGSDAITAKVVYSSLSDYQRTLTNAAWQLTGHKKDSNVSLKEIMMHLEDYSRQTSVRLLEAKNEVRAQHASTITSIKEVTSAIRSLDQAIRLGTEQNQMSAGGAPAGGGTTAPGAGATMGAPPPKATPAAPATMAAPATPATSAVTTATAGDATGIPPAPGYASSASAAAMFPPSAPVFHAPPPMAYQPPPNRAGRLRVSNRDGTVAARAVSPQGLHPSAVTHEWASEYGLGTVNCGGLVYRVLPDSYLEGSVPLN